MSKRFFPIGNVRFGEGMIRSSSGSPCKIRMETATDRGVGRVLVVPMGQPSPSSLVQRWFQGRPQSNHDGSQGFGGEFVLLEECLPQRLP